MWVRQDSRMNSNNNNMRHYHHFTCHPYLFGLIVIIISWFSQGFAVNQHHHHQQQYQQQQQHSHSLSSSSSSLSSSSLPPKVFCRFKGKEYSPGDVWPLSYRGSCVVCTCLLTGSQNCTRQECPTDCHLDKPSQQHPCCRVCDDNSDSSQSGQSGQTPSSSSNLYHNQHFGVIAASDPESGEEEEDGDLINENSEFVSCLHQGKIYRDGEAFTANVTGLPIQATDQCMQCVCQSGMVLCQMKACSSFKCSAGGGTSYGGEGSFSSLLGGGDGGSDGLSRAVSDQASIEACCQRCAAWRKPRADANAGKNDNPVVDKVRSPSFGDRAPGTQNLQQQQTQRPSSLLQQGGGDEGSNNVITDGGEGTSSSSLESSITFRDGGPYYTNFIGRAGEGDSSVKGGEKTSQYDDCVSAGRYYMHGSSWHPIIGPFGTMECVVCKCAKGQIDCGRLKCPLRKEMPCSKPVKVEGHCCPICVSMISNDGSKMCVSGKQEVTALRSHGNGLNGTELINFAFVKQRRNTSQQVDLHEWTLKDGEITQFSTKYISLPDFSEIKLRQMFTLLGATNEKNLEKFTRREKKLEKRCVARCSARISSLERSLRLHRLIARKTCLPQERSVNT